MSPRCLLNETAAVAPAKRSCGRKILGPCWTQPHRRDVPRTNPWSRRLELQPKAIPADSRTRIRQSKNRYPPGRTETEGIAKLSWTFDTPGPHWSPTFQTRDKIRGNSAETTFINATATATSLLRLPLESEENVWPNHPNYWKILHKWWSYIYASVSEKKCESKVSITHEIVANWPSCWYWTNWFLLTFFEWRIWF